MNNLKKKSASMLCKIGRFGVGKSILLGMYDLDVPEKLKRCSKRSEGELLYKKENRCSPTEFNFAN